MKYGSIMAKIITYISSDERIQTRTEQTFLSAILLLKYRISLKWGKEEGVN